MNEHTQKPADDDPEEIWLEPGCRCDCDVFGNRCWRHDKFDDCDECGTEATRYVRADIHARLTAAPGHRLLRAGIAFKLVGAWICGHGYKMLATMRGKK
jgi:hypothetical protein